MGLHIVRNGFSVGYNVWYAHAESLNRINDASGSSKVPNEEGSRYRTMVMDAMGPELIQNPMCDEQPPNPEAQKFSDLLKDADEPLWDGCKNHTKLSAVSQLLNIKSEYNMPEACYDRLMSVIKTMLPEGEKLPDNLYRTKKQLAKLCLGYEKIDACVNNCATLFAINTGGLSKGRIYGFGRSQSSDRFSRISVTSTPRESEERYNKLTKVMDEKYNELSMKMQEELLRQEVESKKMLEQALEESQKREEDARKREEDARRREEDTRRRAVELEEMVRKLIQEVEYTNRQFACRSGPNEQQDFGAKR
ncbi:UNVERIFIED_CONTAM: hypothetical protein Sindi_1660400 [Sesamum indicum]